MSAFYDQIVSTFNDAATLVPSVFTALYMNQPPDAEDMPYAVLEPGDEERITGSFASTFHEGTFTITVVNSTQDLVRAQAELVEAAYLDIESDLSVSGMQVTQLDKTRRTYDNPEDDTWAAAIEFMFAYAETR